MRVSDLLAKKRDGYELSDEEISYFVQSVAPVERIVVFTMSERNSIAICALVNPFGSQSP